MQFRISYPTDLTQSCRGMIASLRASDEAVFDCFAYCLDAPELLPKGSLGRWGTSTAPLTTHREFA